MPSQRTGSRLDPAEIVSALLQERARVAGRPGTEPAEDEGLRERKKRLTRQLISDTATALFIDRGFNQVPVSEVARATGVSEKTVFNYFPTKESLVFDQEEMRAAQVRHAFAQGRPVAAAVELIVSDVRLLFDRLDGGTHRRQAVAIFRGFIEMIEGTPELRAARHEADERLQHLAAQTLADRAGVDAEDPEPQIAAAALLGLWRVQYRSTQRHLASGVGTAAAAAAVIADIRRAGRLIDTGLWCLGDLVDGGADWSEPPVAGPSLERSVRQVVAAMRRARAGRARRDR